MKSKLRHSFSAGVAVIFMLASVFVPTALAATNSASTSPSTGAGTGQALEIAPPLISLTVDPGQTINTQLSLRDVSGGNLEVSEQVNDFVAAGEDGTPKILLNSTATSPYSIKGWVAPLPTLLMVPRQIKNLPITINVPKNASPGGHYGVIRFSATPPELHGTGVSLQASLGSLVLITVRGNVKHSLAVQELSINKNGKTGKLFQSGPLNIVERIKNSGNVHEEPQGLIVIKDMFGKVIGSVNVNQPPKNVLPGSIRKFNEPLDKTVFGNTHLFGRYRAVMNLKYASGQTLSASTSFWVIPYTLIGEVVVLLIVAFFGLRYLIRRHDRRVMEQVRRQSQLNKK